MSNDKSRDGTMPENYNPKGMIVGIILLSALLISFVAYAIILQDAAIESWEKTTPDQTSCEIMAEKLNMIKYNDIWNYDEIRNAINDVWILSDCDNINSPSWRGMDWKPVKDEAHGIEIND